MESLFSTQEEIIKFRQSLLDWFLANKREMPWRHDPSPYRVWVSEIMLQQTKVDTVIPYFEKFIDRIPSIEALASIDEQELLKLWEGLGYYQRVRNMKIAAITLMHYNQGRLYNKKKDLLTLKGIGEYSAGAIASIAFEEKVSAVDGNVLRIMARITANHGNILDSKIVKELTVIVDKILPDEKNGDFNQALMELGALICVPKTPKCERCPVMESCRGYKEGIVAKLPVREKNGIRKVEKKTVLLIQYHNMFAVKKRNNEKLLSGLFEFPNFEGHLSITDIENLLKKQELTIKEIKSIKESKAVFSHIEWQMTGYHIRVEQKEGEMEFIKKEDILKKYPIASAFSDYLTMMKNL